MPVRMYLNRSLGIRVHRVTGRVTAAAFIELAAFYRDHPDLAQFDLISLVDEHTVAYITADELSSLRARFIGLQSRLQPLLVRRSAWVPERAGVAAPRSVAARTAFA